VTNRKAGRKVLTVFKNGKEAGDRLVTGVQRELMSEYQPSNNGTGNTKLNSYIFLVKRCGTREARKQVSWQGGQVPKKKKKSAEGHWRNKAA
jgi:hypothetical protein